MEESEGSGFFPGLKRTLSPGRASRGSIKRKMCVQRVEVTRVSSIVENTDIFEAQIFVQLAFKGMSNDPHLAFVPEGGTLSTPHFPLDDEGVPTWRPNAAWYLERLVFDNMAIPPTEQLRQRDTEVRKEGGNLVCTIYTEGSFFENFELQDFPFDAQDLTFALTLNVRVDGRLGCEVVIDEPCVGILSVPGFLLSDRWSLHVLAGEPILFSTYDYNTQDLSERSTSASERRRSKSETAHIKVSKHTARSAERAAAEKLRQQGATQSKLGDLSSTAVAPIIAPITTFAGTASGLVKQAVNRLQAPIVAMADKVHMEFEHPEAELTALVQNADDIRKFPTAYFTIKVQRRYRYYLWNVMLPTFSFPILGMMQFSLNEDWGTRIECSLGLVLTVVLFKFAVVSPTNFPTVNYLTLLDTQVLFCQLLVFSMAIENGVAATLQNRYIAGINRTGTEDVVGHTSSAYIFGPPRVDQSNLARLVDYYAAWVFAGLILLQIVYFIYGFRQAMKHGTKLEDIRKAAATQADDEDEMDLEGRSPSSSFSMKQKKRLAASANRPGCRGSAVHLHQAAAAGVGTRMSKQIRRTSWRSRNWDRSSRGSISSKDTIGEAA